MDQQTSRALNAINRDFYRRHAEEFSRTRQAPWHGWERVLRRMQERGTGAAPWSLLDVGCGNGRFARFCAGQTAQPFTYVGVDASRALLHLARAALSELPQVTLLERTAKRPHIKDSDRIFWIMMRRFLKGWRDGLFSVKPKTVVRWYCKVALRGLQPLEQQPSRYTSPNTSFRPELSSKSAATTCESPIRPQENAFKTRDLKSLH